MDGFPHKLDNVVASPIGHHGRSLHKLIQKRIVGMTKKSIWLDGVLQKKTVIRDKDIADKRLTIIFHTHVHKRYLDLDLVVHVFLSVC
jgi:hypothetical protein